MLIPGDALLVYDEQSLTSSSVSWRQPDHNGSYWQLTVRRHGMSYTGKLCLVSAVAPEAPLIWQSDGWNFLGRNELFAQAGCDEMASVWVEPG
jgi:hypothetical protein